MKVKAIDVEKCFPEGMEPTSLFLDLTRTIKCKIKLFTTGSLNRLLQSLTKHPRNIELPTSLTDKCALKKYTKLEANSILITFLKITSCSYF